MPETQVIFSNTRFAAREETTAGTPLAEQAGSAILLAATGLNVNIGKATLENPYMSGSLSKTTPAIGMDSDDAGPTIPVFMRGEGELAAPDWSVLMKSIMGSQVASADGVADTGCTTDIIQIKSGCGDLVEGQLVYFVTPGEIRRVIDVDVVGEFQVSPPLTTAPAEDAVIVCGINWMLTSVDHPSFTAWTYFNGPTGVDRRVQFAGTQVTSWEATFEVGAYVPMNFACQCMSFLTDNTAQAVTPTLDTATLPLRCTGIVLETEFTGIASGVPTTTETILTTPNFDVAIGDDIRIEVTADVWETVNITGVSGDAPGNITLTHAAVSVAASALDVVRIVRTTCSQVGESMKITVNVPKEFQRCMIPSSGKSGMKATSREVLISTTPYFKGWQEVLLRNGMTGAEFTIILGTTQTNIIAIRIAKKINTEVSLTTDTLMKLDVSSEGVKDETLGNDHEIVIAAF